MIRFFCSIVLVSAFIFASAEPVAAQSQVAISTPYTTINDGFWERMGIGWGLQGPNWFFNNGGAGPVPSFGGFDPSSQAQFGAGGRAGDVNWNMNMFAGQGSSRSIVNQTPTVVVPNGGTGQIFSGELRPFVTGFVPIVGAGQQAQPQTSLLQQRLQEMKQRGQALKPRSKYQRDVEAPYKPRAVEPSKNKSTAPSTPTEDDPPLILGS